MAWFPSTQSEPEAASFGFHPEHKPSRVSKDAAVAAHMINAADLHGLVHLPAWQNHDSLVAASRGRNTLALAHRIRKNNEKMEAHAWVERDGIALNEPDEHHYTILLLIGRFLLIAAGRTLRNTPQ